MRVSMVPAQVTTVEDKIAYNVSLQQLILLVSPLFFAFCMYILIPPFHRISIFKISLFILIQCIGTAMAIRYRGLLVLNWIILLVEYNIRPRYSVYNKNDMYLRDEENAIKMHIAKPSDNPEMIATSTRKEILPHSHLQRLELQLHELMNSEVSLQFKDLKKGVTHVAITEVKR